MRDTVVYKMRHVWEVIMQSPEKTQSEVKQKQRYVPFKKEWMLSRLEKKKQKQKRPK